MANNGARMKCPCGSDKPYDDCCGPLHSGTAKATTAEQLMRSRFTAFALRDAAYLLRSWHSTTRPRHLDLDRRTEWTRLEILNATDGGPFHTSGTVEFRAHYRERGGDSGRGSGGGSEEQFMQENSTFAREDGAWVYVSGV